MKIKISFDYDLPTYDPNKHDPDRAYALLTYRGVSYAKWVNLKPFNRLRSWKITA